MNDLLNMAASAAEAATTALPYGYNIGDQMFVLNQGTIRLATVVSAQKTRVTVTWANSVRQMKRSVTPTKSIFAWATGDTNKMGLLVTALNDKQKMVMKDARYTKIRVQIKEWGNAQDGLTVNHSEIGADRFSPIGSIISYEQGTLSEKRTIELFAYLLRTGKIQGLQGHYQRTAASLVSQGIISLEGAILVTL